MPPEGCVAARRMLRRAWIIPELGSPTRSLSAAFAFVCIQIIIINI
jgi:hypothetical protein